MDIIEFKPEGKIKRTLSKEERNASALRGNTIAKKEILNEEIAIAKDDNERITAIIKFLGV